MTLISKTYWGGLPFRFRDVPEGSSCEPRILRTADYRELRAHYWTPAGRRPKVAVVCMHPRVDFTRHYAFPRLIAAGIGCLGAMSRVDGDDTGLIHEELLLDVAACVAWLRERRGVERVILLGNSGGGSLSAFYQAQACRRPADRLERTPSGAPTRFADVPMPPADALILLAAHRGQGRVLAECIDGSLVAEDDPLSVDPALDPYSPDNGFATPPGWSRYDDDFVERYRSAQAARVARIDARALAWLRSREAAKARGDARRALFEPVMVVYRTMANLRYVAQHLDPSPRGYGSLLSDRPDLMNWRRLGFARAVTPEAWLSTWSANYSNADLLRNLAEVTCPVLSVHAARDRELYPETDFRPIQDAIVAEDRTCLVLDASHYFEGEPGGRARPDTEALMDRVVPWITARFGAESRAGGASVPATSDDEPATRPDRHATTRHWAFPTPRPAPPAPIRRVNLRELVARPGRFEHHLMVVGRVGALQLEVVTASEPTPFGHVNISDEYAVALPTGDPMLGAFQFLTFLGDPASGRDVGRIRHGQGDLVLHPYGSLHWPGRLRPPFAPMELGPGMRRTGLSLVLCASSPLAPGERPLEVPADRAADVKAYAGASPEFHLVNIARGEGLIGVIGDATIELLVAPPAVAPPRGGWLVVLEGEGAHFPGDLLYIPEGARLDGAGLSRALLVASRERAPEPPPESWERVPAAPFPVFEDGAPGTLPVELGALRVDALSELVVRVTIGGRSAEVPRYWLARFLFRVALHGYALGYLETYGGFYYDDREGFRLGLRGGGALELPRAALVEAVERLYRAVAPPGYVERLT
ncbi:MAG: hypothetical protein KC468_18335 [Myxococcales bacterium]|nr:hypothetical protein [Myxococcales bacterium]